MNFMVMKADNKRWQEMNVYSRTATKMDLKAAFQFQMTIISITKKVNFRQPTAIMVVKYLNAKSMDVLK